MTNVELTCSAISKASGLCCLHQLTVWLSVTSIGITTLSGTKAECAAASSSCVFSAPFGPATITCSRAGVVGVVRLICRGSVLPHCLTSGTCRAD